MFSLQFFHLSITLLYQLSLKTALTVDHYYNSPLESFPPAILQDRFPRVRHASCAWQSKKSSIACECLNWVQMIIGIWSRYPSWATMRNTCCMQLSPSAAIIATAEDQCIWLQCWLYKQTVDKFGCDDHHTSINKFDHCNLCMIAPTKQADWWRWWSHDHSNWSQRSIKIIDLNWDRDCNQLKQLIEMINHDDWSI